MTFDAHGTQIAHTTLVIKRGDITKEPADAIVNAANSSLLGGGGVDGAIHRVGGPELIDACRKLHDQNSPCPTGHAVPTPAGNLPAKIVIHAVGPIWRGGHSGESELLAKTYYNALLCAREVGATTVTFPSISTGAYRFPVLQAASIALRTIHDFAIEHSKDPHPIERITMVVFQDSDLEIYTQALNHLLRV